MADENNANTNNNNDAGNGGNTNTNNTNTNANGGDTTDNGKGGEGGKTIPVESYNVIRDKYAEAKQKLEAIEAEKAEAAKKQLEEQGKFKELADTEKKRADELQSKYERTNKVNALKLAAIQAGTVDADAVERLADLSAVTLSEDGSVDAESVSKLIESLKTAKPYLFGEKQNKPNVGANGGSPADGGGSDIKEFKRSQLRDNAFYKANEKDILAAAAAGKIIDDITQSYK